MICEDDVMHSSCSSLNELSVSSSCSELEIPQQITTYDDLNIIKKLGKAKFPVFLSYSPSKNQCFALKVFPFLDNKINPYFVNEVQFAILDHINVISVVHYELERDAMIEEEFNKISYIVMELAPYGDFFDLIMTHRIKFDEKLARTYFHQLIEGLEYLHTNGVAHLDIKLENLLLGNNYILKIADFDQAHIKNQENVRSKGTICYRAPELVLGECKNTEAADVYSAGIILFIFKSGGILPYSEQQNFKGFDLFDSMNNDKKFFWEKHCEIQNAKPCFFDRDFKSLFNAMVSLDPEERPTIEQIKCSDWYNKPIYTQDEIEMFMNEKIYQMSN